VPDPVLHVSQIEKQYRTVKAVDRLSFEVQSGEIFGLLGPNGAGKTTTVRMLMGIIRPDSGSIRYTLRQSTAAAADASRFGYLPEDRGLYQDVSVLRTLSYFGVLRGMSRRSAPREARRWLDRLELGARADEKLGALSKGNQQKVQFISAILHRPAVAVLDEPFTALDPVNQDLFLDLFRELRDGGMTILLSAHQMQLVERVVDRILLINRGREVLHGSLETVRSRFGLGSRLVLGVGDKADPERVARQPGVESAAMTGEREMTVRVRAGYPLGELLASVGSSLEITTVHTERLSLHDIYVSALEAEARSRGGTP
jgi:ABC-2 type transport system ATP-binding protein